MPSKTDLEAILTEPSTRIAIVIGDSIRDQGKPDYREALEIQGF